MPTIALVDPDAAISFAKAMVRGIKMKVDGSSKLDEEESEEDEDEGDDVVPKPSAAAAAAVPARSANRRKSSLFADSGRGIKVRARAAASSPRPPALVLSDPTRRMPDPCAQRRAVAARRRARVYRALPMRARAAKRSIVPHTPHPWFHAQVPEKDKGEDASR